MLCSLPEFLVATSIKHSVNIFIGYLPLYYWYWDSCIELMAYLVKCWANLMACLLFICQSGKFPTLVTHQESLESKVNETKAMVKFQLKKVLCMGVAVGNCSMEEKQIFQNVQLSVNFLVSLLKKNWQNVSWFTLLALLVYGTKPIGYDKVYIKALYQSLGTSLHSTVFQFVCFCCLVLIPFLVY